MTEPSSPSKSRIVFGYTLIAVGFAVFAVRLLHEGPYAFPRGTSMFSGLGALLFGGLLVWPGAPRFLVWAALALSPPALFFALYGTLAEFEETVSLYATDSAGKPAQLRLWIVDHQGGEWVGMPRWKALEYSLDGARVELLRNGQTRCVVPVLSHDRATDKAIHALKLDKYAVARGAAALGLYPSEARDGSVSLRLDPCAD